MAIRRLKVLIFIFLLLFPFFAWAQKTIQLKSPNGDLTFSFKLTTKAPVYYVSYKGKSLIKDSELGLKFKDSEFKSDLQMLKPDFDKVDDTYKLIVGKTKKARDHHQEVRIPLLKPGVHSRKIILAVRAFNDGIAFRYEFPKQQTWSSYELLDELTSFNIHGDPIVKALFWGSYDNSHEGFYHTQPLSQVKADTLLDVPTLFEFPHHINMAITEANLRDYAGMYLRKMDHGLQSQLSPLPRQNAMKVKASLPHQTPWRVIMISDSVGSFLESDILTSLNEPPAKGDWSWVKTGKTTFHWWNGDILPDTTFAPGINFQSIKYYIDFASRNNIEYSSVIGYGGFAWYKSDAPNYGVVGPHTDITKTVASIDMNRISAYAKEKGVGLHVWVNWKAIYPNLEKSFSQFEKWGIKGMMVDFLNRDDQEMVQIQEEILQKAAEHKLFIQFHGSYKPTGLSRTYPNMFTREGALNYENNKWRKEGLSPEHDLNIVFTRSLAGPTSYHLGGFRAVPPDQFKTQYTRPLMIGTRAHMLAMYVVLLNYVSMVADYPDAYKNQPGFDFLKEVPTNWDETAVPVAEVDKYVSVARRKGSTWYMGTLNNSTARTIDISLDFLPKGNYKAEIYSDAKDAAGNPNHIETETRMITKNDKIRVHLAAGGGQVIRLIKQ